jgi:hypothetical protein
MFLLFLFWGYFFVLGRRGNHYIKGKASQDSHFFFCNPSLIQEDFKCDKFHCFHIFAIEKKQKM